MSNVITESNQFKIIQQDVRTLGNMTPAIYNNSVLLNVFTHQWVQHLQDLQEGHCPQGILGLPLVLEKIQMKQIFGLCL